MGFTIHFGDVSNMCKCVTMKFGDVSNMCKGVIIHFGDVSNMCTVDTLQRFSAQYFEGTNVRTNAVVKKCRRQFSGEGVEYMYRCKCHVKGA